MGVDAVRFPLSVEYTTVVVKMRMLVSAEQVASESSKSSAEILQEHVSWSALDIPASSISTDSF